MVEQFPPEMSVRDLLFLEILLVSAQSFVLLQAPLSRTTYKRSKLMVHLERVVFQLASETAHLHTYDVRARRIFFVSFPFLFLFLVFLCHGR